MWTNEEGSRFVPVMMGSGVFVNAFTLEHALAQRDAQGVSVDEALRAIGYAGPAGPAPAVGAYFEAHIEQGPVLENHERVIGVVSAALGQRWYDVSVQGMEAHAGPTPMELRRDALLAASCIVAEVNRIALDRLPHARGTVGSLEVFPNSRNVIPGGVKLSVDLRAPDDGQLLDMDAALRAACERIAAAHGVTVGVEQVVYFPPQPFTPHLVEAVRANAADLGYSAMDVVSGAGHDAVYLARVAPAAMIFVPCADGISHNEIENAEPAHLEAGCNVLLRAMLAAAGVVQAADGGCRHEDPDRPAQPRDQYLLARAHAHRGVCAHLWRGGLFGQQGHAHGHGRLHRPGRGGGRHPGHARVGHLQSQRPRACGRL